MMKTIAVTSADGTVLEADTYGEGSSAVVLVHGKVFDKESWAPQAEALAQAGLHVLVPNLRGYGKSGGSKDPAGFPQDIAACVAALRAGGAASVSVLGASMGAVAAGKAVSTGLVDDLATLILLSPRAMPAPEKLRAGHIGFVVSEDEDCYPEVEMFHAAAPEPKTLHVVPGDAHAQFIFRTDAGAALLDHLVGLLTTAHAA